MYDADLKKTKENFVSSNYIIIFDGGSRGNPGEAYGSFRIQKDDSALQAPARLSFGRGTNNEAEYMALIAAIEDCRSQILNEQSSPAEVTLEIRGDSSLVLNQLEGSYKAKDARMRRYRDKTLGLLVDFKQVKYVHQARAKSVRLLGH